MLKVWTGRGSILHLLQEVHEHAKAVTSLAVLQSGEKLYSGSLDKTTRVCSYLIILSRQYCFQTQKNTTVIMSRSGLLEMMGCVVCKYMT